MSLRINNSIEITDSEIVEEFIRSSGPGGQNVNKVSSAVQLRFNLRETTSMSDVTKHRILLKLSNQLTKSGEIIITARESRSQEENRRIAREKLIALLKEALFVPKIRKKTKATKASKERRIASKEKRGENKKLRQKVRY